MRTEDAEENPISAVVTWGLNDKKVSRKRWVVIKSPVLINIGGDLFSNSGRDDWGFGEQ